MEYVTLVMPRKRVQAKVVAQGEPFQIPEGAEIVDTVVHGRSIKVFVLEDVEERFTCDYELGDGKTCQMQVGGPDERCHHHEDQ